MKWALGANRDKYVNLCSGSRIWWISNKLSLTFCYSVAILMPCNYLWCKAGVLLDLCAFIIQLQIEMCFIYSIYETSLVLHSDDVGRASKNLQQGHQERFLLLSLIHVKGIKTSQYDANEAAWQHWALISMWRVRIELHFSSPYLSVRCYHNSDGADCGFNQTHSDLLL